MLAWFYQKNDYKILFPFSGENHIFFYKTFNDKTLNLSCPKRLYIKVQLYKTPACIGPSSLTYLFEWY